MWNELHFVTRHSTFVIYSLAFKLPLNFFHLVNFEQVAFLDVVESGQLDAAFITLANLLGIVLLATKRIDGIVADNRAVANDPGAAVALDHTAQYATTGNRAHAANFEYLLNEHTTLF